MNAIDDYDVRIRDYYRLSLYLGESFLKIKIPPKAIEKDAPKVMNPMYNRDKIYDRLIMNVEIGREENDGIDHQANHVVEMKRELIWKPF